MCSILKNRGSNGGARDEVSKEESKGEKGGEEERTLGRRSRQHKVRGQPSPPDVPGEAGLPRGLHCFLLSPGVFMGALFQPALCPQNDPSLLPGIWVRLHRQATSGPADPMWLLGGRIWQCTQELGALARSQPCPSTWNDSHPHWWVLSPASRLTLPFPSLFQ